MVAGLGGVRMVLGRGRDGVGMGKGEGGREGVEWGLRVYHFSDDVWLTVV